MRIALVSQYDLNQKSSMSYHVAGSLRKNGCEITGVQVKPEINNWLRIKERFYRYIARKSYSINRDPILVKRSARQVESQLRRIQPDLVLSHWFDGSQPLAYLETDIPYVLWTDVTFATALDFYPHLNKLCKESVRDGKAMEKLALEKACLVIYTSQWAADEAIRTYSLDESKVKVVNYGPNLESTPSYADVKRAVEGRSISPCKLLFLGLEWIRKGGDLAIEIVKKLNAAGIPTELAVAGPVGLDEDLPEFVKLYGRINKNEKEGLALFEELMRNSHFLLLPTRADCTPHAIFEASANGLPTISSDVGGLKSMVTEGVNGRTFPLDDVVDGSCSVIAEYMNNYDDYIRLALSSYHEYENRLNWVSAGAQVVCYLSQCVKNNAPSSNES